MGKLMGSLREHAVSDNMFGVFQCIIMARCGGLNTAIVMNMCI